MHFSEEEIARICDQASRDNPDSQVPRLKQIKRVIIERGLDELLTGVTDPELAVLARRVGHMLVTASLYRLYGEAILSLTDMATEVIELVTIRRDSLQYLHAHWDTLPESVYTRHREPAMLVVEIALLSAEIATLQSSYDHAGRIAIYTGYFDDMDQEGPNFLLAVFGQERALPVLIVMRDALRKVRDNNQLDSLVQDMPDIPKDKMS